MVVTTCSIVFKGLIKTLWRTIPNFCSFWPQLDCRIPFWHLWLELSTLQDASHLPRATTQVTQRTAVGVPLATLASWPCWVAASTPASSFWELPDFCQKMSREIWKQQHSNSIHTSLKFLGIACFFVNFSSKKQLGVIQNLCWQYFTLLYHLSTQSTYMRFLNLNMNWHFITMYLLTRCLMLLTNQADPGCFCFRISWILMERRWFYFFRPLHFLQGLRSLKHWLLQKLSMKIFDQKFRFLIKK